MKVIYFSILIFMLNVLMCFGYNLNAENPFTLKYKASSYFGYSILLHESAMIVGAPKDNYSIAGGSQTLQNEPGAVWKYIFDTGVWKQIKPTLIDERGFVSSLELISLIFKKNGWFGASMALKQNSDVLTICAPRTKIYFLALIDGEQYTSSTMHGMCYTGSMSTGYFEIEDPNLSSYDFSRIDWYNPLRGFSVHYPSSNINQSSVNKNMIIGCPNHEYVGSVRIGNQNNPVFLLDNDDLGQFGYAVNSGRFFKQNQLLYVGGGPGSNLLGQVGIIDSSMDPAKIIFRLNGTTIGEYFGSSLAVGDINNDGLDDLVVGAPHWGNDNGRVYVYFGNVNGFFDPNVVLNGYLDDGMFGYAITCGDLDSDGFDDLIVGAPYANNGAIYVYNGALDVEKKWKKPSQKITLISRIRSFGFSLAKPVDIDGNGFPDVGVGAYKSGHAIILKSRPVVQTNLQMSSIPQSLHQNSTNFFIKICVKHIEKNLITVKSFSLTLNIDEYFKRVNKTQIVLEYIPDVNISVIKPICLNTTVHILEKSEKSYYDPIHIVATHNFGQIETLQNNNIINCQLCPIEVNGEMSKTTKLNIPFDLECGSDEICSAILELRANFGRNESAWIIGSDDIIYEVYISNYGESAYSIQIIVEIPKGISLRTYFPLCKRTNSTGIMKIVCNDHNPLITNDTRKFEFPLDMSQINDGSANGTYLNFNVSVKTRSENTGAQNLSTSLLLLSHIVTTIEGDAENENYLFTLDEEINGINFRHSYRFLKSGATPINKAILYIDVPTTFENLELIRLSTEPNIQIAGKLYKCSVFDISLHETQTNILTNVSENLNSEFSHKISSIDEFLYIGSTKHFSKFYNTQNDEMINLDCSLSNVSCGKIICDIPVLKNKKDKVILELKFITNLKLLKIMEKFIDKKYQILFKTQGWIEIIQPIIESKKIVEIITLFREVEKLNQVNIWIIGGSVLLGLLVLFIIAIVLWKLGFFRREKKNAMTKLKTNKNEVTSIQFEDIKL